jgi:hypothetical protein
VQERLQDNIDTLRALVPAPLLAIVPAGAAAAEIAALLNWRALSAPRPHSGQ